MSAATVAWTLFIVYLLLTAVLAWQGGKRTTGSSGFAVGSGRMNPVMAGMTLGACLASSAMFVIILVVVMLFLVTLQRRLVGNLR